MLHFRKFASRILERHDLTRTFAARVVSSPMVSFMQTVGPRAFATVPIMSNPETFMNGSNSVYIEQMYEAWKKTPSSVHVSWDAFFKNLEKGLPPGSAFSAPPSITTGSHMPVTSLPAMAVSETSGGARNDDLALSYYIRAFQYRGHEVADLDPLGIKENSVIPELDYRYHGFTDADLDRKVKISGRKGDYKGFLERLKDQSYTLRQVEAELKRVYCGRIGVEYMHISDREKCAWIRSQVEHPKWQTFSVETKLRIHERLAFATIFEKFVAQKFNTVKRFGLEGAESVIPGLKTMVDLASEMKVESFVIGMPHRGRLNVLSNLLKKARPQIFKEFQGVHDEENAVPGGWTNSGDVKYHLGTSSTREYKDGRKIKLSLLPNPSHLEAVDTVVLGMVRAKQYYSGGDCKQHLAVLIHGDAAMSGQGIVYETMQLAKVEGYDVGGTIHVIINNQVGFTTDPSASRSTVHASDIAKAFSVPIFHCNGDDPLAVCSAFEMAVEWRQQYGEDCIVDVVCYRRHGHNEMDQPLFTQPLMYKKIASHPDTLAIFEKSLVDSSVATEQQLAQVRKRINDFYDADYEASKTWHGHGDEWLTTKWAGFNSPRQLSRIRETGVDVELLRKIGLRLCKPPAGFDMHPQLVKIIDARRKTLEAGKGIDWATAEALSFGSLMLEDNHIRLSGQDVERGTFSHRHAVIHDQTNNQTWTALKDLSPASDKGKMSKFTVHNSILSEFGVLGFELGYSMESPNQVVIWEAQFGDFCNGGQVIIDQFISSMEDKWMAQSGLVMLLPHGYDGQGAEHSSCRLERFLQLSDDDPDVVFEDDEKERKQIQHANWQVVNCTTPANYFHALRRQIHRDYRKPLIICSPKNLLRHKLAVSDLIDMEPETKFRRTYQEVDDEISKNPERVKRVAFCSGKVYYDLLQERRERKLNHVAIIRLEQIAPFPFDRIYQDMKKYNKAEIVWVQEEPKNAGSWTYVSPRIITATRELLKKQMSVRYIGRPASAAPATGYGASHHNAEQLAIVNETLAL